MPVTKRVSRSWIAGLMERRVALGVAATASILMVVLLVAQPANKAADQAQRAHDAPPVHKQQAAPPGSETPRYSIPAKSVPRQQEKAVIAKPTVKAITPSTPAKPVKIKPPAPKAVVQKPAVAKPVVKAVAKPSSPAVEAAPKATKQDMNATPKILFVQVGAYRVRSSAQQQASKLLQKGWSSMVTTNAKGWFVVRIGPTSSRDAAEKLRQQLLDKAKLKGFIVEG